MNRKTTYVVSVQYSTCRFIFYTYDETHVKMVAVNETGGFAESRYFMRSSCQEAVVDHECVKQNWGISGAMGYTVEDVRCEVVVQDTSSAGNIKQAPMLNVLGGRNSNTCPQGSSSISDPSTCASVATFYGFTWTAVETEAGYPAGCYAVDGSVSGTTLVYLNKHPTGTPQAASQPICVQECATNLYISGGTTQRMLMGHYIRTVHLPTTGNAGRPINQHESGKYYLFYWDAWGRWQINGVYSGQTKDPWATQYGLVASVDNGLSFCPMQI
jgi:hypothetical protein